MRRFVPIRRSFLRSRRAAALAVSVAVLVLSCRRAPSDTPPLDEVSALFDADDAKAPRAVLEALGARASETERGDYLETDLTALSPDELGTLLHREELEEQPDERLEASALTLPTPPDGPRL